MHHDRIVPFDALPAAAGLGTSALERVLQAASTVAARRSPGRPAMSSVSRGSRAGAFRETVAWVETDDATVMPGDRDRLTAAVRAVLENDGRAMPLGQAPGSDDGFVTWALGLRSPAALTLAQAVCDAVNVPLAASGRFGQASDLAAVAATGVSAIAIADALHWKRMSLAEIKQHAAAAGLDVRGVSA